MSTRATLKASPDENRKTAVIAVEEILPLHCRNGGLRAAVSFSPERQVASSGDPVISPAQADLGLSGNILDVAGELAL